ncbi:Panacea domain-containing protein [Shewanella japonica]|uniref:Panacea domain-containing protein n=1 Tax=Shewanella TaxID=22 RepID=UPI002494D588|nr:Panacea domain-containing protein [Shewanella japonica]
MFSEERVTQMAAYFLIESGRRIAYIKLLKLLYLAERKALAKWGSSMSGDRFVSMPHGPVLSQTYDLIRGHQSEPSYWQTCIKDEENYEVSLEQTITVDDLDELSRSELRILGEVFAEFGHMSRFEIVNYTHDHCEEWADPNGSSFPIKPESILRAVGKDESQISQLLAKFREDSQLDIVRAALR